MARKELRKSTRVEHTLRRILRVEPLPRGSEMRIALNLSLFVEKSHRTPFDLESKLWKLALLINVFYRNTYTYPQSVIFAFSD